MEKEEKAGKTSPEAGCEEGKKGKNEEKTDEKEEK